MIYQARTYISDLREIISAELPYENLKNKTVMVTGANGLIGSSIVDTLMMLNESYNYDITVVAVCRNRNKANDRFSYYLGNRFMKIVLQDMNLPFEINEACDVIIHAASNAHPFAYATEPVETMKSNLLGTIHLLEYAKKNHIDRLLFVSSSEIYGENPEVMEYKEESLGFVNPMQVRACYPESKRAAETLCVSYTKEYGIDTVIVRLGYVYGAAINKENTRADSQFLQKAVNSENIVMKSDGLQFRSYCYITDAITGIFCTLLKGNAGEAYNISNKNSHATIRDFVEILAELANVIIEYENPDHKEKAGYSKVRRAILNSEKLEALGWKPSVDLQVGLERIMKIYNEVL